MDGLFRARSVLRARTRARLTRRSFFFFFSLSRRRCNSLTLCLCLSISRRSVRDILIATYASLLISLGAPAKRTQSTIRSASVTPGTRVYSLRDVFEGRKGTGGNVPGAQTRGRYTARESAGSGRPQGIAGREGGTKRARVSE